MASGGYDPSEFVPPTTASSTPSSKTSTVTPAGSVQQGGSPHPPASLAMQAADSSTASSTQKRNILHHPDITWRADPNIDPSSTRPEPYGSFLRRAYRRKYPNGDHNRAVDYVFKQVDIHKRTGEYDKRILTREQYDEWLKTQDPIISEAAHDNIDDRLKVPKQPQKPNLLRHPNIDPSTRPESYGSFLRRAVQRKFPEAEHYLIDEYVQKQDDFHKKWGKHDSRILMKKEYDEWLKTQKSDRLSQMTETSEDRRMNSLKRILKNRKPEDLKPPAQYQKKPFYKLKKFWGGMCVLLTVVVIFAILCLSPLNYCKLLKIPATATITTKGYEAKSSIIPESGTNQSRTDSTDGPFTEKPVYCNGAPCSENEQCIDKDYGHRCTCLPGLQGEACDEDINECEENMLACPQGSVCLDTRGSFSCIESQVTPTTKKSKARSIRALLIAMFAISGITIVVAMITAIILRRRRQRSQPA